MIWVVVSLIICWIIYKIVTKESEMDSKKSPPSDLVNIFGCSGTVDCGYWSPEMHERANGQIDINAEKCYCSYKKQWFKKGSPCPFAKEHPELIVHDDIFDN